MIDIDLNNYEEKIIDYFDDKLNSSEIEQLMSFLNKHPEIKEEFELYEEHETVEVDEYELPVIIKNKLKREPLLKHANNSNFDQLCIAKIENDLSENESNWFDELMANDDEKKKELEKYKLTKLKADLSVVYQEKSNLKRTTAKLRRNIITVISVAASVIIIMGLYFTLTNNGDIYNEIAVNQDKKSGFDKIENNEPENQIIEKVKSKQVIKTNTTNINQQLAEVKVYDKTIKELPDREVINLAKLEPRDIGLQLSKRKQEIGLNTNMIFYSAQIMEKEETAVSLKTFFAQKINERLFNKEKDKIEMFDIAQAGVQGINKIAGTQMTLERIYDQNGNLDKTEFSSKLIAFSTPVKK